MKSIDLFYGTANNIYSERTAKEFIDAFHKGETTKEKAISFIGYHVEAGNDRFIDCANACVHQLGINCLNFVLEWYRYYLDEGKVKNSFTIDKDLEENYKKFKYTINKKHENNRKILENFQRNNGEKQTKVYGNPPTLDKHESTNGRETNKPVQDINVHGSGELDGGQGKDNGERMDGTDSTLQRKGTDSQGNETKAGVNKPSSTLNEHKRVQPVDGKESAIHDSAGVHSNRSNVGSSDYEHDPLYQKLKYDLEIIFELTDLIPENAKALSKYIEKWGKATLWQAVTQLGHQVVSTGTNLHLQKGEPPKSGIQVFTRDNWKNIHHEIEQYKEHALTEDYGVIDYQGTLAIIYDSRYIVALADSMQTAIDYMNLQQEEFNQEKSEILAANKDLYRNVLPITTDRNSWGKKYSLEEGQSMAVLEEKLRPDFERLANKFSSVYNLQVNNEIRKDVQPLEFNLTPTGGSINMRLYLPDSSHGLSLLLSIEPINTSPTGTSLRYGLLKQFVWRVITKQEPNAEQSQSHKYGRLDRPFNEILQQAKKELEITSKSVQPEENTHKFIKQVFQHIDKGEKINNTPQLRSIAESAGLVAGTDYKDISQLYDLAGFTLNTFLLKTLKNTYPDTERFSKISYQDLDKILNEIDRAEAMLPTRTERSHKMLALQQFSTPPSLALIAGHIARITESDTVLEPSAGEGNLLLFPILAGARIIANEIDSDRAKILEGFKIDRLLKEDAKHIGAILNEKVSVVLMNPPFSRDVNMGDKIRTGTGKEHIESALSVLEPDGRLVAITGRGMAMDSPTYKQWWDEITEKFNVVANIHMDGKAYKAMGTTFDNRLIVIDNNGPTRQTLTTSVKTYKDLLNISSKIALRSPRGENIKKQDHGNIQKTIGSQDRDAGKQQSPTRRTEDSNLPGSSHSNNGQQVGRTGVKANRENSKPNDGRANEADNSNNRNNTKRDGETVNETSSRIHGVPGEGDNGNDDNGKQLDQEPKKPEPITEIKISYQERKIEVSGKEVGYDAYAPQIKVKGAMPHPAKLVESTAMASVSLPKVDYIPSLEPEIIQSGAISDAQLEDVILAGASFEKKLIDGRAKGYFLGGGTGYGKGRTVAAIILDNIKKSHGKGKAVWISKNDNAHFDSKSYWQAVGGDEKQTFSLPKSDQKIALDSGLLLTTYTSLAGKYENHEWEEQNYWQNQPKSRFQQIVQWLGKDFDGVIVFDESHQMGNAIDSNAERGIKKASKRALAGVALQDLLPNAKFVYSSATGASEVMNLAYATRLGLWGDGTAFPTVKNFIDTINGAGIAGMELVSRDLKSMGLYTAKSLSFEGVSYENVEHELTPDQVKLYDQVAKSWQLVLSNIKQAISVNNTSSSAQSTIMSAFWASHQRFFQQIIVSLQMSTVILEIEKDVKLGRAPVIQLVNTNEAMLTRNLAEMKSKGDGFVDYEMIDISPKNILIDYVRTGFPTQLYHKTIDGKGNEICEAVFDSEGKPVQNPRMVKKRDELIEKLDRELTIPEGPLDLIINYFGHEQIAEVTGRTKRLIRVENENGHFEKMEQTRGKSIINIEKNEFMEGKRDILIFSDAGGTGASFHADKTKGNQKQRAHYILQPGWRADSTVQGFGRTHRSNEASEPIFKLVTTNLKAQRRFLSSIARRLDQLGALTKGQRQTGGQGILDGSSNLEGKYAQQALFNFYRNVANGSISGLDMQTLEVEMALKIYKRDNNGAIDFNEDVIFNTKMFLNRLMSLTVSTMDKVFEGFMECLDDEIIQAKNKGIYDEGIQIVKAISTKVISNEEIYTHEETGAKTFLTTFELEVKNELTSFNEIRQSMDFYGKNFVGYFQENTSNKIYGFVKNVYADFDGKINISYRRFGVSGKAPIEQIDFESKYKEVNPEIVETLWQKEFDSTPKTRKKTEHIIKGLVLPIWGSLPLTNNVRRYIDDDDIPHLGRFYSKKDVVKIRNTFNAIRNLNFSVAEIVNNLMKGGKATLSNNFQFVRKKHQGIYEIGILGASGRDIDRLKRAGANFRVRSSFDMNGDFFVPYNSAERVIERIMELYNASIIAAENKNGESLEAKGDSNTEKLEKVEEDIKAIGYRNLPPIYSTLVFQLSRVLELEQAPFYENLQSGEYGDSIMPLNIEKQELNKDEIVEGLNTDGAFKLIMSHNYIQEGDLMNDPRIDFAVFPNAGGHGIAYPLNFEQHGSLGRFIQFVEEGKFVHKLHSSQNSVVKFVNETWIPNLLEQGRTLVKNREAQQMLFGELLCRFREGTFDFKLSVNNGIITSNNLRDNLERTGEEQKRTVLNNVVIPILEEYHKQEIKKAINENRYVATIVYNHYKEFSYKKSLYKEPKELTLNEFLKAEVVLIDGKKIRAVRHPENHFYFKHGEHILPRTKEGYSNLNNSISNDSNKVNESCAIYYKFPLEENNKDSNPKRKFKL